MVEEGLGIPSTVYDIEVGPRARPTGRLRPLVLGLNACLEVLLLAESDGPRHDEQLVLQFQLLLSHMIVVVLVYVHGLLRRDLLLLKLNRFAGSSDIITLTLGSLMLGRG